MLSVLLGAPRVASAAAASASPPARRAHARPALPARPAARTECGQIGVHGATPVVDPTLKVAFELPLYWLCVPGTGAVPEVLSVLERVDSVVTQVVTLLRKATVGAFQLLPGGKIPCLLEVSSPGVGPLPSSATFRAVIENNAGVSGVSLSGLTMSTVNTRAGHFRQAEFTQTEPGGATVFRVEDIGSVAHKLVLIAFQGAPRATVLSQAHLVMGSVH